MTIKDLVKKLHRYDGDSVEEFSCSLCGDNFEGKEDEPLLDDNI